MLPGDTKLLFRSWYLLVWERERLKTASYLHPFFNSIWINWRPVQAPEQKHRGKESASQNQISSCSWGKRGLEGHLLFNKGKNGVNQAVTSDSDFSSRLASNLTPRLIYMTTDLTACTCPQNIPSLAKGSSEDGVAELMTASGEYIHVPQAFTDVLSCVLPTPTWDVTQEQGSPSFQTGHRPSCFRNTTSNFWFLAVEPSAKGPAKLGAGHQNYPQTFFAGNIQFAALSISFKC